MCLPAVWNIGTPVGESSRRPPEVPGTRRPITWPCPALRFGPGQLAAAHPAASRSLQQLLLLPLARPWLIEQMLPEEAIACCFWYFQLAAAAVCCLLQP
jgi:hypothetical protein